MLVLGLRAEGNRKPPDLSSLPPLLLLLFEMARLTIGAAERAVGGVTC